jgi:hypothetical protein
MVLSAGSVTLSKYRMTMSVVHADVAEMDVCCYEQIRAVNNVMKEEHARRSSFA